MHTKILTIFIFLSFLCFPSSSHTQGFNMVDPINFDPDSNASRSASILGLILNAPIGEIEQIITKTPMILIKDSSSDSSMIQEERRLVYKKGPQELPIEAISTQLIFLYGNLAKIDFLFPPTYENFLIIKNTLTKQMGNRFSFSSKKENMDGLHWQGLDWNTQALNFYKRYNAIISSNWLNGRLNKEQIKNIKDLA